MTNLDTMLKSKDIILPTKIRIVKAMVFPVVTYGSESWTVKKAECWEIDAFELWCWRRLLRAPSTARRSNQSILKEIDSEYHLKGLMLKFQYLVTWCKQPTHWKRPSCWEKTEGRGEQTLEKYCQPPYQRLSVAWSAPVNDFISTCQPLD